MAKDEATHFKTEYVILCCVVTDMEHLRVRSYMSAEQHQNDDYQGIKTCPSAASSITNLIRINLGLNPSLCGEKSAHNSLNYSRP
jgi:hypothetical protein